MSSSRKLKRKSRQRTAGRSNEFASRSSTERFKTPGSEKLWAALLGWPDSRLVRMWVLDAVHDALLTAGEPATVVQAFGARRPDLAPSLSEQDVEKALSLWQATAADGSGHFHYLAALLERLGLPGVSAEELASDWKVWTSLGVASPAHKALLASLAQAEQAAALLLETTQSEPVRSTLGILRGLWLGLAYGDPHALHALKDVSQAMTRPG